MHYFMEKIIRKLLLLSAVLFSLTASAQSGAGHTLQIRLTDGTTKSLPTSNITSIQFQQTVPPSYEGLTGRWLFVASPMGNDGGDGIVTSKIDTIRFTATLSDDGTCLMCRADTILFYKDKPVATKWKMMQETDEESSYRRLCWVLDAETPVAILEDGQYLYLLSENIQTSRLEGMTLRSDLKGEGDMTFKFPQNQEVYAVVSSDKPYKGVSSVFLEIWASARFIH